MEIRKEKNAIRKIYLQKRAALTDEQRRLWDEKICSTIIAMASFRFADTILMYAPSNGEPDIMPIAKEALRRGKTVAFPRCKVLERTMSYHIIQSIDELMPGAYRIPEPHARMPQYKGGDSALCLIPGLVFDNDGYRIGYGKGYYDRFLTRFSGKAIGVVYNDFICERVPRGRFDLSVEVLVTEKGVRIPGEN
ncbi:MAG: 5-formyltetrahydrofolate cyclo-ligase [Clostridiales bacterium]|nr:5-formyltetrahydrofolate cyclo-ligase [Clostridiales bacterium]